MKLNTSSHSLIKMILLAQSGGGKSSAIIPLAIPEIIKGWPGMKLCVLDFDGKFEEVAVMQLEDRRKGNRPPTGTLTKITKEQYDAALNNIDFEVCVDPTAIRRQGDNRRSVVTGVVAYQKAISKLAEWEKTEKENSVIVTDSFTYLALEAIRNFVQEMNGRLNQPLEGYKDYAPIQGEINTYLRALSGLKSNVVITAHQGPMEIKRKTGEYDDKDNPIEEIVDSLILPISVGQAGRITVPAKLNHMLVISDNAADERVIYTKPKNGVMTKTPFFARAEPTYDLDRGLVRYFNLARAA